MVSFLIPEDFSAFLVPIATRVIHQANILVETTLKEE